MTLINGLSSYSNIEALFSSYQYSNYYQEIIGYPFPSSITYYKDSNKIEKISEKFIAYNISQVPSQIIYHFYSNNILVATITDTFTYTDSIFPLSKQRTIT